MRVTRLVSADYRRMPWKNGGGTTTELVRFPADGDFDWRISAADVASDGLFSQFPGCDRMILTLRGAGMRLMHLDSAKNVTIGPLEPHAFSGDERTVCTLLEGPIRDFNVIFRRDRFVAQLTVIRCDDSASLQMRGAITILYCAEGSATVGDTAIGEDETMIIALERDHDSQLAVSPSSYALLIRVDLFETSAR